MAVGNTLLERAKGAIRTNTSNEVIVGEVRDTIEACKADLRLVGVHRIYEDDALIIRAVILYVRSAFNFMGKGQEYKKSYDLLKMSLALAGDYNEPVKPQEFTLGKEVILNGAIYPEPGNEDKSITKAAARMYIVELLDRAQYKNYIGLAEEKKERAQGYAMPDVLRVCE